MATKAPPPDTPPGDGPGNGNPPNQAEASKEVELVKVVVSREGQKVSAQWAIHPQIKHDLQPDEWKEVSELMAKVTGLVGTRFSKVLSDAEPDKPGTA
jgi:5,10-methylenetetrahydrofolate reductase